MRRDEVLRVVGQRREELRRLGVKSLALFGSTARDEARPDSDVDFLVEFDRPVGFFELIEVKQFLERLLECPVDLGTARSLKPRVRDRVMREAAPGTNLLV